MPKIEMILTHSGLAPVLRPRLLVRTAEERNKRVKDRTLVSNPKTIGPIERDLVHS